MFLEPASYDACVDKIKHHEGFRAEPYKCTSGKWTQGYGSLLPWTDVEARGMNDPSCVTETEAEAVLYTRLDAMIGDLLSYLDLRGSPWDKWPQNVRIALADMVYNLGINRLKGFKRMFAALDIKDYTLAAEEALDSKWATQVGGRARAVAALLSNA